VNGLTIEFSGGLAFIAPRAETGSVTITYTYDPLYHLTAADYSTGDYYHYSYDATGNRLLQESEVNGLPSTVEYQYDIANRLTSAGGANYILR
jgi:uncharacterized protein RhaS with RHS repeats